jgi:hypothetical protein
MFRWVAGALFAAMSCAPAQAEVGPVTVVQSDTIGIDRGFASFDQSLGVLLSATLTVDPSFRRYLQILVPGVASSVDVSWDASEKSICYFAVCSPLIANGSATLPLTYSTSLDASYAYQRVDFTAGRVTVDLDVARFLNPDPYHRHYMTRTEPGYSDNTYADIFDANGYWVRNGNAYGCVSSLGACDFSRYQLIYTYAPGGVPEPATWAMLILGFGAIGSVMRRRSATAKASRMRLTYA